MNQKPMDLNAWKERAANSPASAAKQFLKQIESIPSRIRKSIIATTPSLEGLSTAFEVSSQSPELPLAGVPFLLKDLYDIPGFPTTASSSFLSEIRPTPSEESSLSRSFREQGAVFAGKTQLNEFAYGLSGENLHYGNCPHPLFPDRLSGGSSSGSAWAVKSGLVPIATGTDTGGSIRVPAAWCDIFGLRLSPNHWSTQGCFPLAPSFDTAGWFCASATDMALSIETLVKPTKVTDGAPKGINLIDTVPELCPESRRKMQTLLEKIGAVTSEEATQAYQDATRSVALHYAVLQSIEALGVHQEWLDDRQKQYDFPVWQRIERARHWSEEQVKAASLCEQRIKRFFNDCLDNYDFVAIPATQSPAITASQHTEEFRARLLEITAPGSFSRLPILTIPIRLKNGLSSGLQILYKENHSDLPLRVLRLLN
ncbi:amidase [Pelagicoccus mobilis]|uniref:Amidase n=1 Tax=Pelagicoccus mobilis TaxID=415221 RepID=A0A934RYH1_9BACT|nr:amidase [Pelagicoccus mobilis]MBK1875853.1 amidase [Pelagicoccus mobilis]